MVIVILLFVVAAIVGARYFDSGIGLDQRAVTEANLLRIREALTNFVVLNQRLPCPAAGSDDTGAENPAGPAATCNSPDGVVPWAPLALRRGDIVDGWGRKISYRVFSGNTGLTQAGSASMVNCNTDPAAIGPVLASGKCNDSPHDTQEATYLAYRASATQSLSLQGDSGPPSSGYAFVLISHGESGRGAFAATGGARLELPTAGSLEQSNTQAGTLFNSRTRSSVGIEPSNAAHFDDLVVAVTASELFNRAKLTARLWALPPPPPPPPTIASQSFTATEVENALGAAPGSLNPLTNANTGQNDIDFGSFRVRAFGSTGRNVGFGQGTSGTGIGSIGSGNTSNNNATINAATSESLRFQFDSTARYLGITLIDFGTQSGQFERVRFTFNVGGSTVQVTKTACRAGDVLANFTVNPGGDFDEVYVEARSTSGGADSSRFLIKAIATCPSGNPACAAPGAAAGDNCP